MEYGRQREMCIRDSYLILTGRELRFLKEGDLYLDVHTQDNLPGVLKVNLSIPGS